MSKAVMQQALEALQERYVGALRDRAIAALEAALAEPVQEPVAVVGTQKDVWRGYGGQWVAPGSPIKTVFMLRDLPLGTPLYTAPTPRKPLTEEQIEGIDCIPNVPGILFGDVVKFARAIERKHGIGEQT